MTKPTKPDPWASVATTVGAVLGAVLVILASLCLGGVAIIGWLVIGAVWVCVGAGAWSER